MENRLSSLFEMLPGGRAVPAEVAVWDANRPNVQCEQHQIVPADVVAFVAGVNLGSVVKVFAALEYLHRQGEVHAENPWNLHLAPLAPPCPARKAQAAAYIRAALQNPDQDAEAIADALGLGQRALRLR